MGSICNADGCYIEISKVLKILDWPKYIDVFSICACIEVYVYYQIWIINFAQVAAPIYQLLRKNTLFIYSKKQVRAIDLLKLALTTFLALVPLDYIKRANDIILAFDVSL